MSRNRVAESIPDVNHISCSLSDVDGPYECTLEQYTAGEGRERVEVTGFTFHDIDSHFMSGGPRKTGNGFSIELDEDLQCWVEDGRTDRLYCEERDEPPTPDF